MLGDGKYVGLRARVATAVVCVSILAVLYALYEFTSIGHAGFYLLAFLAATFAAYEYGAVLYGAPYLLGSLEGDALGVRESSLTLAVGASLIAVLPVLGQFILGDLAWGGFGGMPLTDRMALFLSLVVLALSLSLIHI